MLWFQALAPDAFNIGLKAEGQRASPPYCDEHRARLFVEGGFRIPV